MDSKVNLITSAELTLEGEFSVASVQSFTAQIESGHHSYAQVTYIAPENFEEPDFLSEEIVSICDSSGEVLFSGYIESLTTKCMSDYSEFSLELVSVTKVLDCKKHSKSFQNINMTYRDIIDEVLKKYQGASFIANSKINKAIGFPIIQYKETDWQFIERLASHFNYTLFPKETEIKPRFFIGAPPSTEQCAFSEIEYISAVDDRYYQLIDVGSQLQKSDFAYYQVESNQNYNIGDNANFKDKNCIICEKTIIAKSDIVSFSYKLANTLYVGSKKCYNVAITGASILGTVLKTEKETLKVHLDIDDSQKESEAFPFKWTPATGNLMYLMPQAGTQVSLYFSDEDETSAKIVNCVRTNGGDACAQMSDPNKRYLLTEHGKSLNLLPENMSFSGTSDGDTPLTMLMDDNEGFLFTSNKKITLSATGKIEMRAPNVGFEAKTEIIVSQVQTNNYPWAVINEPMASFDLSLDTRSDLYGRYSMYAGWLYENYEPFNDAPEKGSFDMLGFIDRIAAGLVAVLVVAAIAVAIVVTAGAAAPLIVGVAIGAVATGSTYVGIKAYGDFQDGNLSSYGSYIKEGVIGAVVGAISGAVAPAFGFWGTVAVGGLMGGTMNLAEQGGRNLLLLANGEEMLPVDWGAVCFSVVAGAAGSGLGYGIGKGLAKALPALKAALGSADEVIVAGAGSIDDVAKATLGSADEIVGATAGSADEIAGAAAGSTDDVARAATGSTDEIVNAADEIPKKLTRKEQLALNRKVGAEFEAEKLAVFKDQYPNAETQIHVDVFEENGDVTRIILDGIATDGDPPVIYIQEYKATQTAPLTISQTKAFPNLTSFGGIVKGAGKGIFTEGFEITAGTLVEVIRGGIKII